MRDRSYQEELIQLVRRNNVRIGVPYRCSAYRACCCCCLCRRCTYCLPGVCHVLLLLLLFLAATPYLCAGCCMQALITLPTGQQQLLSSKHSITLGHDLLGAA